MIALPPGARPRLSPARWLVLATLATVPACGSSGAPTSTRADASTDARVDHHSPRDGAAPDAHHSGRRDSTTPDAGAPDATAPVDAAAPDAPSEASDGGEATTFDAWTDAYYAEDAPGDVPPLPCLAPLSRCDSGCVDKLDDPGNCGACGNACEAGLVCSVGACAISCASGLSLCFANAGCVPYTCAELGLSCGSAGDGCGDVLDCGPCLDASAPDASPDASLDARPIDSGPADAQPIDSAPADAGPSAPDATGGFCVDEQTDPAHCGGCAPCPRVAYDLSPACASGVCKTGTCVSGRADCDGEYLDGCETDIAHDPANCGACGHACSGGTPYCSQGVCAGECTATLTSETQEASPYTEAVTVSYAMVGGGGGGPGGYGGARGSNVCAAGGGGGSSAIVVGSSIIDVAAGGTGGASTESTGSAGGDGAKASGSFTLDAHASLLVLVGGGGGGGYLDKGGGGGAGYCGGGGGGGDLPGGDGADGGPFLFDAGAIACSGGVGGDRVGGAAGPVTGDPTPYGAVTGTSGGVGTGGNGGGSIGAAYPGYASWGGGYGGDGAAGGLPDNDNGNTGAGGGGGGYGAGGGGGGCFEQGYFGSCYGAGGGSSGGDGASVLGLGGGGLGARTWAGATTLPVAAGTGGRLVHHSGGVPPAGNGGNAGLVILTYPPPDGMCRL